MVVVIAGLLPKVTPSAGLQVVSIDTGRPSFVTGPFTNQVLAHLDLPKELVEKVAKLPLPVFGADSETEQPLVRKRRRRLPAASKVVREETRDDPTLKSTEASLTAPGWQPEENLPP